MPPQNNPDRIRTTIAWWPILRRPPSPGTWARELVDITLYWGQEALPRWQAATASTTPMRCALVGRSVF